MSFVKRLVILLVLSPLYCTAATDLPSFAKVEDGLYRGGRPTPSGLAQLVHDYGIKTDINLQGGDLTNPKLRALMTWWEPGETFENILKEAEDAFSLGLEYQNAPLNSLAPIDSQESALVDQVLEIMHDPTARPVYIHCEHGHDRTGMLIALYRVKYESADWSVQKAYDEWTNSGHGRLNKFFTYNLDIFFFEKVKEFHALVAGSPR